MPEKNELLEFGFQLNNIEQNLIQIKTNHRRKLREFGFKYYDQFMGQCDTDLERQVINDLFKKGKRNENKNPRRFEDHIGINDNDEIESSIAPFDESEHGLNILSLGQDLPFSIASTD